MIPVDRSGRLTATGIRVLYSVTCPSCSDPPTCVWAPDASEVKQKAPLFACGATFTERQRTSRSGVRLKRPLHWC